MRSTLMAETCRELTVELQRSVYPSVRLLEGIAYAEDGWIDILLGYDGFNVQFITVISNNLLLFHGIKGWEAAALECYERKWGGEREEHLQGTLKPSVEGSASRSNKAPCRSFKCWVRAIPLPSGEYSTVSGENCKNLLYMLSIYHHRTLSICKSPESVPVISILVIIPAQYTRRRTATGLPPPICCRRVGMRVVVVVVV